MLNFAAMTASEAFTAAHEMARNTVLHGDDYRATFSACLKVVFSAAYNLVNYFLQALHTALDGGDMPAATAAVESLDLYPEPWTAEQEDSWQWLARIYHDCLADEAA